MTISAKIKTTTKSLLRSIFGYDPSLRKVIVPEDFRDQKMLLSGIEVKTIFDVGANVGQTTRKYRKLFPKATIHSFEPFPPVFALYKANAAGDRRIIANEMALSDTNGTTSFFTNKCHYTNSLLPVEKSHAEVENYEPEAKITVKTETIEDYCRQAEIKRINILKMDVQGGESLILKAANRLLEEKKIDLIYVEVAFTPFYEKQPVFADVEKLLGNFGYTVYKMYNEGQPLVGKPTEGDIIFVRPGLASRAR